MDIYTRQETEDPQYRDSILEVSDELSMLLMQIDMLLFTAPYEVLGYPNLSARLKELLFKFNLNEGEIRSYIRNVIVQYIPLADKYNIEIEITFYQGQLDDIAVVDIVIDGRKLTGAYVA